MISQRRVLFSLVFLVIASYSCTAGGGEARGVPGGKPDTTAAPVRASQASPGRLTVYAAASLTDAFTEIGQAFERLNPGVQVGFSFAGSQVLRTQVEQGAQADVIASADMKTMQALVSENFVAGDIAQVFVRNKLLVILPANNPANVEALGDLAKPNLKLVLADASVPAGDYARQVLDNLGKQPGFGADFATRVLKNVASNETDVRQVVTKVELGEADAGIVYESDAVASPGLITLPIPDAANVVAEYPIAVLQASRQKELALAFVGYVLSPEGQATLAKWGFERGDK